MTGASLLVPDTTHLGEMPDVDLLTLQADIARMRREFDLAGARVAGEVARRSSRALGSAGLSQRTGSRTPEALVHQVTGVTRTEARTLVRVGEVLNGGSPWLSGVVTGLNRGELTLAAADAITGGLGSPSASVASDDLSDAALALVARAPALTPEAIAIEARALRDELDAEAIGDREAALRARRYLRFTPQSDGMVRLAGLLDPESAARVQGAVNHVTSPRRGGPRFVDTDSRALRDDDDRTLDQAALDALVDMIDVATGADHGSVFGDNTPSVTIHVGLGELESGHGAGHIEGQNTRVSLDTVKRYICCGTTVATLFDGCTAVDVGRDQRLFTRRQRRALAARDGGCRFPGCGRPPSMTEAHHILEWGVGGTTDLRNGILLCKHHHLLVHNNGWGIRATDTDDGFEIVPPASIDPAQIPRTMPRKDFAARVRP